MGNNKIDINTGKPVARGATICALILVTILFIACGVLAVVVIKYVKDGSLVSIIERPIPRTSTAMPDESEQSGTIEQQPSLGFSGENPLPDIIDSVSPSVVGIIKYGESTYKYRDDPMIVGSGSGFVVSEDGYILTNHHVIEDAKKVTVMFKNGDEIAAEIIGSDVTTDVAVLKIEYDNLIPVKIGDSDILRNGEFVLAIGNPLDYTDLYGTVTFGIVSAPQRQILIGGYTNDYIQIDAAVNPGNSGGPLINLKGEVIGMTTAKYISAGYDEYGKEISAEGIGFALPIKNVSDIMKQLIEEGKIERPGIGVSVYAVNADDAKELGIVEGILVNEVTENGPADLGGIKPDDVILEGNGIKITTLEELRTVIEGAGIGNKIDFTIHRDGKEVKVIVTVGDMNKMP